MSFFQLSLPMKGKASGRCCCTARVFILSRMTYGNGDSVSYTYDAFDRQQRRRAKDTDWTQVLFKIFNIRTGTADILTG